MSDYKPTPPSQGKWLYHMTRLENMPSILEHGLLSRKQVEQFGLLSMDIANPEILIGRENVPSPRPLPEYVPFHFFAKNPFDRRVCFDYGCENMVIIVIKRTWVERIESARIITAHPLSSSPKMGPYQEIIRQQDWWDALDEARARYPKDNDSKQKCMAECLIPDEVAPEDFDWVFVYTEEAKQEILKCPNSWRIKHYPQKFIKVDQTKFP